MSSCIFLWYTWPHFLLVLDLLDRVRSGFFEAVYLAPPASTWSRLRNAATEGQTPLRSRSGLELVETKTKRNCKSDAIEPRVGDSPVVRQTVCVLSCEETWNFTVKTLKGLHERFMTSSVLVMCGGARHSFANGPATPGRNTNLPKVESKVWLRWPILVRCGGELLFHGILPGSCPCVPQQERMRKRTSCPHLPCHRVPRSGSCVWLMWLMDRCSPLRMAKCYWKQLTHLRFFSFSNGVHSRTPLYSSWLHGSLSRALLADVASSGKVTASLGTSVPADT